MLDHETYTGICIPFLNFPGLVSNGTIAVGSDAAIRYSYPVGTGNQNGRTLQFFSISANERMRVDGKGDFYEDFAKVSHLDLLTMTHVMLRQLTFLFLVVQQVLRRS